VKPKTLSGRLIGSTVALVVVVIALVGITTTLLLRASLMQQLDEDLHQAVERSQRFDGFGPGGGNFSSCANIDALPPGQNAGSVTAVFGDDCSDGAQITNSGQLSRLQSDALAKLDSIQAGEDPQTLKLTDVGTFRVAAAVNPQGARVVFGLPTDSVDDTITSLIRVEVLLAMLAVAVAMLVVRRIVTHQLQPLTEVAATAHDVTATPLSTGEVLVTPRVRPELTDPSNEVGQVGLALNQLLEHIEAALRDRHESEQNVRQFLADASHELRTPLTTIKGYAELSRRTGLDPTDALAKVESEVGRISTLVEDMLLLARLDSGRPLGHQEVDLTQLVVEAVADAKVVGPSHRWRLEVPSEPVTTIGDELRLHQAVTNLLNNARRHTPAGTTVTARVLANPTRIEIHDDGPGIPSDLMPVLWERFTRGDSSRTRSSGGAGLGTALVKAIMLAHDGTVEVQSSPGDTAFTLIFSS